MADNKDSKNSEQQGGGEPEPVVHGQEKPGEPGSPGEPLRQPLMPGQTPVREERGFQDVHQSPNEAMGSAATGHGRGTQNPTAGMPREPASAEEGEGGGEQQK